MDSDSVVSALLVLVASKIQNNCRKFDHCRSQGLGRGLSGTQSRFLPFGCEERNSKINSPKASTQLFTDFNKNQLNPETGRQTDRRKTIKKQICDRSVTNSNTDLKLWHRHHGPGETAPRHRGWWWWWPAAGEILHHHPGAGGTEI